MASKTYTAQEMREFANYNDAAYARNPGMYSSAVSAALRQAADALEREKKYEYTLQYSKGSISKLHDDDFCAIEKLIPDTIILRRSVGEWEEVK